jgi:hypothetical protein
MSANDVSNEQLLTDLENTKKEYRAYRDIANGFMALSELPENQGQNRSFIIKAQGYQDSAEQCAQFQEMLEKLAKERGL